MNLLMATESRMNMPMDSIVEWLVVFHRQFPLVGILMLIMALDVAVGLCAAVVTKTVSSTISQHGMYRKVIMLLLVGVGAVLDPYAGGIPLSKMISMAFLVTEAISIVENSARAGVPIPAPLYDVLQKLKNNEKASVTPGPQTVNIASAGMVDIHSDSQTKTQKSDSKITIREAVASADSLHTE